MCALGVRLLRNAEDALPLDVKVVDWFWSVALQQSTEPTLWKRVVDRFGQYRSGQSTGLRVDSESVVLFHA